MASLQLSLPDDLHAQMQIRLYNQLNQSAHTLIQTECFCVFKNHYDFSQEALLELEEQSLLLKKDLFSSGLDLSFRKLKQAKVVQLRDYTAILISPDNEGTLFFLSLDRPLLLKLISHFWDIALAQQSEDVYLDAVSELANLLWGHRITVVRKKWKALDALKIPQVFLSTGLRLKADNKIIYNKQICFGKEGLCLGMLC